MVSWMHRMGIVLYSVFWTHLSRLDIPRILPRDMTGRLAGELVDLGVEIHLLGGETVRGCCQKEIKIISFSPSA